MNKTPQTSADFEVPAGIFTDDFLSDLDVAFDSIQMGKPRKAAKPTKGKKHKAGHGMSEMHTTFLNVTRAHLQPTLRYLKAIEMGVSSKDICELVQYVVGPLVGKARKVGLKTHTKALIDFQRVLKAAAAGSAKKLSESERTALAEKFRPVKALFKLDRRGHATAVVNLLGFYRKARRMKDVTPADLRKLFAIGIPSLTMLRKTSVAELSSLSGIGTERMSELRKSAREFSILSYA